MKITSHRFLARLSDGTLVRVVGFVSRKWDTTILTTPAKWAVAHNVKTCMGMRVLTKSLQESK